MEEISTTDDQQLCEELRTQRKEKHDESQRRYEEKQRAQRLEQDEYNKSHPRHLLKIITMYPGDEQFDISIIPYRDLQVALSETAMYLNVPVDTVINSFYNQTIIERRAGEQTIIISDNNCIIDEPNGEE